MVVVVVWGMYVGGNVRWWMCGGMGGGVGNVCRWECVGVWVVVVVVVWGMCGDGDVVVDVWWYG